MSAEAQWLPDSHPVYAPGQQPVPVIENGETRPVATFDQYRAYCDEHTDNMRKVGLLDPRKYEAAMGDDRTIYTTDDGIRMMALAPIEDEAGYDAERCRDLSGQRQFMLLTVPLG